MECIHSRSHRREPLSDADMHEVLHVYTWVTTVLMLRGTGDLGFDEAVRKTRFPC